MMILTAIIGWAAKIGIGTIARQLIEAKSNRESAETEREKLQWNAKIAGLEARLVLQQSETLPLGELTRFFIAVPFVIHINKVVLVDPIVCPLFDLTCTTDPLGAVYQGIMATVVAFFFLKVAKESFS